MSAPVVVRVAVLALALLLASWFALGVRQAQDTRDVAAILASEHLTVAEERHAASLLHAAALLNPDRAVDVLRARLELAQGNKPGARAILKRVVSGENSYLEAWVWLAKASVGDLRDFYAAAYRIRQLLPPVPSR